MKKHVLFQMLWPAFLPETKAGRKALRKLLLSGAVILVLVTAGCQVENPDNVQVTENESSTKITEETNEKTDIETPAAETEETAAQEGTVATVTRVVDGDTLEISLNGKTEDVRLLLVDTPETVHPDKPVEPFGPEASRFVKEQLEGEQVRIVLGAEERDHYGRLLAYVYLGDETIQEMLLENGLAATAYLYNDLSMLDEFHAAQKPAREAGIGVWSIPGYAHVDHNHGYHYEETEEEIQEPEPADTGLLYDPSGPDRDCGDFRTHLEAQAFMEAAGAGDPHRLDGADNDGLACESLP